MHNLMHDATIKHQVIKANCATVIGIARVQVRVEWDGVGRMHVFQVEAAPVSVVK